MRLHWVHTDCLSSSWFLSPGAPAIFVFDDAQIAHEGWGLKRLLFLYECVLTLPVEIRRGAIVESLLAAGATEIVTLATPDPWLQRQMANLGECTQVRVLEPEPFVRLRPGADLKRFSRYWRMAESQLID